MEIITPAPIMLAVFRYIAIIVAIIFMLMSFATLRLSIDAGDERSRLSIDVADSIASSAIAQEKYIFDSQKIDNIESNPDVCGYEYMFSIVNPDNEWKIGREPESYPAISENGAVTESTSSGKRSFITNVVSAGEVIPSRLEVSLYARIISRIQCIGKTSLASKKPARIEARCDGCTLRIYKKGEEVCASLDFASSEAQYYPGYESGEDCVATDIAFADSVLRSFSSINIYPVQAGTMNLGSTAENCKAAMKQQGDATGIIVCPGD